MKNKFIILLSFISISFVGLKAQDTVKLKNNLPFEKEYLPQAGEFSIGIGAIPILEFLGNILNGYGTDGSVNTINGALGGGVINLDIAPKPDVSIMGKYFIQDKIAARLNIGIVSDNTFEKAYVASDEQAVTDPLSTEQLIDYVRTYTSGGILTGGAELRLGKSKRMQGILGADLLFAYQTNKVIYEYGNELTELNTEPTASSIMPAVDAAGYRTIKKYNGNNYYTGGMLSAGVEYFIIPKLAIGSEVNLMLYYKFGTSAYEIREGLDQYNNQIEERTVLASPGNNSFVVGTDNFVTKLYLSFYF